MGERKKRMNLEPAMSCRSLSPSGSSSSPSPSSSSSASSVRRKIREGLAKVKRRLTFSSCGSSEKDFAGEKESSQKDVMAALLALSHDDQVDEEKRMKLPSLNNHGGSLPRGGLVGCEYEYTVMNGSSNGGLGKEERAYPATARSVEAEAAPQALPSDQKAKQKNLRTPNFCEGSHHSDRQVLKSSGRRAQPDWANGLPPDFVEMLATHLRDSCLGQGGGGGSEGSLDDRWQSVQDVYNAAAVCRRWRDAVQRSCFQRSRSHVNNRRVRRIRRKKTLADEMLCHPHQLLEKAATDEDVIKCYIVRERQKGPFCSKKYKLKLGADYLKANGKTLLVAHHQLLATKSAYNIYLSSRDGCISTEKLGQLHSSPYGTLFELHSSKKTKSGSIRRTKSGNIKYTFNMLGGRGPRSVQVNLTEDKSVEEGEDQSIERERNENEKLSLSPKMEDEDEESESQKSPELVLENKLPRWHELLQCWCLDFGGRVKCASVKNFQLVSKDDPEEIILQFGKVDCDVFTMDFKPKLLSAQQAFMICLSTFDSKLSCF